MQLGEEVLVSGPWTVIRSFSPRMSRAGARACALRATPISCSPADHAGRVVPRRLSTLGLPPHELGRHITWDISIAGVTERLSSRARSLSDFSTPIPLVIIADRWPDVDSSVRRSAKIPKAPGNRT